MSIIKFVVIFTNLISFSLSLSDPSECHLNSPCKCQYDNGTQLDLSNLLSSESPIIYSSQNATILFHPCSNTKNVPYPVNELEKDCECQKSGYALCMLVTTSLNGTAIKNCTVLGKSEDVLFKLNSDNENFMMYKKNSNVTMVQLGCTNLKSSYLYSTDIENNLILFSPHACLSQATTSHKLSTGSTLVIIFLIVTSIYLGLGILFKIFITGASGVEILPNIEFWQDLPALVRDGAKFIQNGCKVDPLMQQNNQETYDAI